MMIFMVFFNREFNEFMVFLSVCLIEEIIFVGRVFE